MGHSARCLNHKKIFEVGLAQAGLFIVILSKNSVVSKWVREELDTAIVRKIEGVTRIVPVVIDDCEIPISLRTLLWIDLRSDRDGGIRKIVNLVTGDPTRPPLVLPRLIRSYSSRVLARYLRLPQQLGLRA